MTLESKLRALVGKWRGATKAITADGASRPLEWEGKDILRLCADRIEALLAERPSAQQVHEQFLTWWVQQEYRTTYPQSVMGACEAAWNGALLALAERQEPPRIVCLCGSTRFANEFMAVQFRETIEGKIVLSVGCFPRKPDGSWDQMQVTDEQKVKLDELHKRKIDLADEVFVVNVGGYIGSSTRGEIDYAVAHRKPVRYLELAAEPSSGTGERK